MPAARLVAVASASLAMFFAAGTAALAQDGAKEGTATKEQAPSLKVGDKAPALKVSKFVKGSEVKAFEEGKVYVVEFWATWCGPCIKAIPHLTELQKQFADKGVKFVGVSVWEDEQEKVEPFVKKMGAKMDYSVAMDHIGEGETGRSGGFMATNWLRAAGRNGIPCTFVVDQKGKVAWIGHPQMGLEEVVGKVLAGNFDGAKFEEEQAAAEGEQEAWTNNLRKALAAKDWDTAVKLFDEGAAKNPGLASTFQANKFNILLTQKKDYPAAYKYAAELAAGPAKDDPEVLNSIAWAIVDTKGVEQRDNALAQKIAERAVELTKREDPAILDTLARAHFEKGDMGEAVRIQTEAVEKESAGKMKKELEATLKKYKDEAAKRGT
ncbi:MAG: redoxin family protein [Phycisphaerales bacterium]